MMNLAEKIKDFVGYDATEDTFHTQPAAPHRKEVYVTRIQGATPSMRISLTRLATVDDARAVIRELSEGIAVLFSVAQTPRAQSRRLLDFVCGGLYAYEGWVERIGADTYLLLPQGIDVLYME